MPETATQQEFKFDQTIKVQDKPPKPLKEKAGYYHIEALLGYTRISRMRVGAAHLSARCLDVDYDYPTKNPEWIVEEDERLGGHMEFEIGIAFDPNFGNQTITYFITLNMSDYLELHIAELKRRSKKFPVRRWVLLEHYDDLGPEEIGPVVEQCYDEYIREHFHGFIPM